MSEVREKVRETEKERERGTDRLREEGESQREGAMIQGMPVVSLQMTHGVTVTN